MKEQQFTNLFSKVEKNQSDDGAYLFDVAERLLNALRIHLAQAGVTQFPTEDVGLIRYLGAADVKVGELILQRRVPAKSLPLAACDAADTFMHQLSEEDAFKHAQFTEMRKVVDDIRNKAEEHVTAKNDKAESDRKARESRPQQHMACSDPKKVKVSKANPPEDGDAAGKKKLGIVVRDSEGRVSLAKDRLGMNGMGIGQTVHHRSDGRGTDGHGDPLPWATATAGQCTVLDITESTVTIVGDSGPVEVSMPPI